MDVTSVDEGLCIAELMVESGVRSCMSDWVVSNWMCPSTSVPTSPMPGNTIWRESTWLCLVNQKEGCDNAEVPAATKEKLVIA